MTLPPLPAADAKPALAEAPLRLGGLSPLFPPAPSAEPGALRLGGLSPLFADPGQLRLGGLSPLFGR